MSKYTSITILVLVTCAITFASCDRIDQMTNVGIGPGTSEVPGEATIIDKTDLGEPQEISLSADATWLLLLVDLLSNGYSWDDWNDLDSTLNGDSLAIVTMGTVTEAMVLENGVNEGDSVGDYHWVLGKLGSAYNTSAAFFSGYDASGGLPGYRIDYTLTTFEAPIAQQHVPMLYSSRDPAKIWLNGEVVYTSPLDRDYDESGDFPPPGVFNVNLKSGNNLLLIKRRSQDGSFAINIEGHITLKEPGGN